jgi:two-component system LytT family response regulator
MRGGRLTTSEKLRVVVADDERPARSFLVAMLRSCGDVDIVGEASGGAAAVTLIEEKRPDLALLDLQMPEVDGLSVVRLIKKAYLPLVAFVTAYDEYAVRAFDLNAIDYLLKPVEPVRLRRTLQRAHERLEHADFRPVEAQRLRAAAVHVDGTSTEYLRRIPVRDREDIVIVAVDQLAAVVADGELLHLTITGGSRYTINYRLKDLEARLDPAHFIRLSRGALVNVAMLERVSPMPGGTYVVTLRNKQQLSVSRQRARVLREHLLRL